MLNWGILGPGKIAGKFCDDLKKVDGMAISGVASRSTTRAQEFASRFDIPNVYSSYEEMLSSPLVDVIYIATPHTFHHEHTLLCLQHNKHVLCEKPAAINSRELEQMINSAAEKQCFLMEAIWTAFLPSMKKVKELIREGAIGELKVIQADFGFAGTFDPNGRLYSPELAGGALLDVGIYPLFLAHTLLGAPDQIHAVAIKGPTGVDATTAMTLKYNQGAIASLNTSVESDTHSIAMISGTKGFIKMNRRWHETKSIELHDKNGLVEEWEFPDDYLGYKYEIEEVAACIAAGKIESNELSHQFSRALMASMDEIRKQIDLVYPMDKA